jgi:hypothetical protein
MDDVTAFGSTVQPPPRHEVVTLHDADVAARVPPRTHGEPALEHPTGRSSDRRHKQPVSRHRSALLRAAHPAARQGPVR